MTKPRISERTIKTTVLALAFGAAGVQQYQWFWATQIPDFPVTYEPMSPSDCCQISYPRSRYAEILDRSPFSLDVPVENTDLTIRAYGVVSLPDTQKLLIKFASDKRVTLLSLGENHKGWTVLGFDARKAELRGPRGIVSFQFKPPAQKTERGTEAAGHSGIDSAETIVREVEEIINANG